MTLTLGIWDVFAYGVPGSLYLALLVYLTDRLGWIGTGSLDAVPGTVLIVSCAVASYVLGHVTYGLGRTTNRLFPARRKQPADAREEFVSRVPSARGKAFVEGDMFVLLARLELHHAAAAAEATRLRVVGVMLRNLCPPLLAAAVVAVVEGVARGDALFAGGGGILLLAAAVAALAEGDRRRHWARLKTLELSLWLSGEEAAREPAGLS